MDKQYLVIISFLFIFSSCTDMKTTLPTPKKEDKLLKIHGDTRVDPYYWLNNRENPEVISYLEKENKYSQSVLKSTKKFQKELFVFDIGVLTILKLVLLSAFVVM